MKEFALCWLPEKIECTIAVAEVGCVGVRGTDKADHCKHLERIPFSGLHTANDRILRTSAERDVVVEAKD